MQVFFFEFCRPKMRFAIFLENIPFYLEWPKLKLLMVYYFLLHFPFLVKFLLKSFHPEKRREWSNKLRYGIHWKVTTVHPSFDSASLRGSWWTMGQIVLSSEHQMRENGPMTAPQSWSLLWKKKRMPAVNHFEEFSILLGFIGLWILS